MTPEWRYHPRPLVFRKGDRVRTYRPADKWQEKAIRGVMRRHGWRLVPETADAMPAPRFEGRIP
jgi:hypothetical protein